MTAMEVEKNVMLMNYAKHKQRVGETFKMAIENRTGRAVFTRYAVYPGVQVGYIDGHIQTFSCYAPPIPDAFAINHCQEGRIECAFDNGEYLYMAPGDMSIGWRRNADYCHTVFFPSSHYYGASIFFATDICQPYMDEALGTNKIQLADLCNRFCQDGEFGIIVQEDGDLQTLFAQLYHLPKAMKTRYLQMKLRDILIYLNTLNLDTKTKGEPAITMRQVEIVKSIHDSLVNDLRYRPTIPELAEQYGLGQTYLKKTFRLVYGKSILQFMKQHRIETAARLLATTTMPIAVIGIQVGYDNPSKFTDAFSQMMGCLPKDYRKASRQYAGNSPAEAVCPQDA